MVNMWLVRAGVNAFLIDEFEKLNIVAIGWGLGDLTNKTPDEIRELVDKHYPNNLNRRNGKISSNEIKFRYEIKEGDYVLSYNPWTRNYLFGKISSDYYYSDLISKEFDDDDYSDVRDVEWLSKISRDDLKKSTQNTLGARITVSYIDEDAKKDILNVFNGKKDAMEKSACIIRKYLNENNLGDLTNEKTEELLSKFQGMFSPDKLKSLDGSDILYTIFPQKGNDSTLCYNLEFSDEFKWLCGGIRGGSTFKFSLFKYSKTNKWTVGSAKNNLRTLSEDEAIVLATKIRDVLIDGAEYIKNNTLESVEDYINFENELNRLFKDLQMECPINPTHSWIHKYYTLNFPDKFIGIHVDNMRKDFIRKFRIEPENGFYAIDGQFYQLTKQAGIKLNSLYDDRIVGLFFKSNDKWNPINEGVLVELEECEKKPITFNEKRNIIYFGAPGTGKSYNLNQDKDILLKDYPKNYERVTLHPDYSYANFVGTYKPVPENKSITYKYVPGPFMRVLKKAINNPNEPYLLIIEEINRANVAAVFGDVFQLLDRNENNESEYDIETSQDMRKYINEDKIKLPSNLFLWATMNSADQGVFPMDTAFKRRWDFKYFSINSGEALIKNTKTIINGVEINWNNLRKAINHELLSYKINEDKLMGPFFAFNEFMNENIDEDIFKDIFKNKIIMYLFEDAARSRRNELFSGVGKTNVIYSQICESFDEKGIEIFTDSIKYKFIEEGMD